MNKRTDAEINAYVEGYNACFRQYMDCLKGRRTVMDAIRKMEKYKELINDVAFTERSEDAD